MKRSAIKSVSAIVIATSLLLLTSCEPKSKITYHAGKVVSCSTIPYFQPEHRLVLLSQILPCLDGTKGDYNLFVKGPVVLNVWGSWCGPCEQEMKYFRALAQSKKVKIVGIDVEERNMTMARQFVVRQGMTWPSLYDPDGRTRSYFGMGVPLTWFIDAQGNVRFKQIGVITSSKQLSDLVYRYLGVKI